MKILAIGIALLAIILPAAVAQTISLPCETPVLTVAADGSGLWAICRTPAKNDHSDIYWLTNPTGAAEKIVSVEGIVDVIGAPVGPQAIIVLPQKGGWGQAVLYEGAKRAKELPIKSFLFLWSPDAQRIYFYGGTTLQADAWNTLAIYDMRSGSVQRAKLRVPTEIVSVCRETGRVYTETPKYPGNPGSTIEYTPDLQFVRKTNWLGSRFSAHCVYAASTADYHGPLPWAISEVASGRQILSFPGEDEGKITYSLVAWNPKNDALMLRLALSAQDNPEGFDVFDVRAGTVVQKMGAGDTAYWSAEGDAVLVVRGHSLRREPVKGPR